MPATFIFSVCKVSITHNYIPILCLFSDQFSNFYGHTFKVVTVSYFPYVDYVKSEDESDKSVTFKDSLDARLYQTITSLLNFT